MENILKDINAVVGVTGSFVCNEDGQVLSRLMPSVFDDQMLSNVSRTMAQTVAGLKIAQQSEVGDIDLLYNDGRLVVKDVGEGCLCILCVKRINVPLLNLTANVAVKKLRGKLKEAEPVAAAEVTPQEPETKPEPESNRRMTLAEVIAANLRR
ncbi:MAG: roadblock/LC7 domain-containing protein [Anaerolineae bacterium]|jgi:predicted regulator of Ras-like GTPase activity (Roadblock/LC7/MglB family)